MRASLVITGIEVEISVPAGPLETIVAGRYATFLGALDAPVCSLHIQPGKMPPLPPGKVPPGLLSSVEPVPLVEREGETTFRVAHPSFFGLLDLEGAGTLHSAADPVGLDHALRILFALLAPHHGAFMLNACGVLSDSGAHIFTGPSGAGEAWVAGLAGDRPLLTGGYVMVRNLDGAWLAGSTPFWTYEQPGPPRESNLARLWSLRPSPAVEPCPPESGATLHTVMANAVLPTRESQSRRAVLDLAVEMAMAVPTSKLFLDATSDVWQQIEASLVTAPTS